VTSAIHKQKSCRITDRKSAGPCDRYRECSAQSSAKDREYLIGTHKRARDLQSERIVRPER
jgi:hypothetical protein